jgi:hypothetical protein
MEPELTDREWWLVRITEEATLKTVIAACDRSGWPGKLVAQRLLDERDAHLVRLREKVAIAIKEYKPDA